MEDSTDNRGQGVWLARRHLFEVNDQAWFPQTLREKVQDYLTIGWINRLPIIQPTSPAALVSRVLSDTLGPRLAEYVYVDFASGAGGPTPYIEEHLNRDIRERKKVDKTSEEERDNAQGHEDEEEDGSDQDQDSEAEEIKFVLTDISPHVAAWEKAAKRSKNISFIPQSVDATNAPSQETLLKDVVVKGKNHKKVMRLFSLAFHHFDDDLAGKVLENTIETADGFCIFELQSRHFASFILVSLLWPLAMLVTPIYFLHSPGHLFFTYLVPIIPFIWVYDGYISCLRTRTPDEIKALLRRNVPAEKLEGWKFKSGQVCHTRPVGWLHWVICYKDN